MIEASDGAWRQRNAKDICNDGLKWHTMVEAHDGGVQRRLMEKPGNQESQRRVALERRFGTVGFGVF